MNQKAMMNLKSPYSELALSYRDFIKLQPNESLKGYESATMGSYLTIIANAKSQEGLNAQEIIKSFVEKVVIFIGKVIKLIMDIIFKVITFFKKLVSVALDDSFMKKRSAYYEEHKQVIMDNFTKYASQVYLPAIPPKNTYSFSSDNKITLSIGQTIDLLDELCMSFKKRVELWDEQNKQVNNRESNTIFDQLYNRAETIRAHITDSVILASIGIRLPYDLKVMALYDSQVKDYIINAVSKGSDIGMSLADNLGEVFRLPKKVIKVYLFGKDDAEEKLMSVADFLRFTGVKEFEKLTYNDMSRIKANMIVVDGLLKKMDIISKKLETNGELFINSLQKNKSVLYDIYSGGSFEANNSLDVAHKWILPILSFASSFYSYFSNIIVEYAICYCRHRKYLAEAAKLLVERENINDD
jgi:hypothetical protein